MDLGRWRRQTRHLRGLWVPLTVFAGVGLALLFIVSFNARLRPILLELACAQTSNQITAAIDRTVAEQAVAYSDLVTLERSESGDIVALTSNMAHANVLRAQLLDTALTALDGLETLEMKIPLGTVLDWDLLSGLGPDVHVRILYTGTASAEFENEFTTAGINQTRHQIIFKVDAEIAVLLPGRQCHTTVSTRVCVAETIIVGKVPETYLQIQ